MKTEINRYMFSQIGLNSGSLTVLSSTIYKLSEEGEYHGIIYREKECGYFSISVNELSKTDQSTKNLEQRKDEKDCECDSEEPEQSQAIPRQINIDLKKLDFPFASSAEAITNRFILQSGGYVRFYVSNGPGGYYVEIYKIERKDRKKVFDSRELDDEDLYTAIVLRPGTYSITNINNKNSGVLVVTYPEVGKIPKRPEPIAVRCTRNAITPDKITIHPTQPLIFSFEIPSRINIELIEPEDRPRQKDKTENRDTENKKIKHRKLKLS